MAILVKVEAAGVFRRLKSRQQRREVRLRGLSGESAEADFVPLLPRFQPTVRRMLCLLLLAICLQSSAHAWGDKGHEMINRLAAEAMPAETPRFFRAAVERLAYLGPDPDRWSAAAPERVDALNAATRPDHFLDMEFVSGVSLPRTRYDYMRALLANGVVTGDVKLETPGFLPYRIAELAQMLRREWELWRAAPSGTRAEKERRRQIEENILHVAGILGHYVADGSNPHHTTWHYNGWVEAREPNPEGFTTARGIHARFEDEFVNRAVEIADVRPLVAPPRAVTDFFSDTLTYLRASHDRVLDLYRLDKRDAFRVAPANTAVNAEGKRFAAERMAAGAAMLRDIWVAAMKGSSRLSALGSQPKQDLLLPGREPRAESASGASHDRPVQRYGDPAGAGDAARHGRGGGR
jgi:hypothetical protein